MKSRVRSAKGIAQSKRARITHGIYALQNTGESSLDPAQRSRLQELKDQFASEPGRVEYRRELASFLAMMIELGMSNIREIAEQGGNIWESPPVARMGVYLNALIRLMDGWPKDPASEKHTILDVLNSVRGNNDDKQGE